jgi:fatty-acyl-CoA synthase
LKALTVTTKRLATHLRTAGPADGEPVIFLLKGPSMFSGYFEDLRASAQAVDAAGWFHTRDLAYGDGFYFIVDRKKDVVVSGGENVYPAEVERALCEHPAVLMCAVAFVPQLPISSQGKVLKRLLRAP